MTPTAAGKSRVGALRAWVWTPTNEQAGCYSGPETGQNIRAVPTQDALGLAGQLHRAMLAPGFSGIRRSKGILATIPAEDRIRFDDLRNRDFTAATCPSRTQPSGRVDDDGPRLP